MNKPSQSATIRRASENDIIALSNFYVEHFPDKPLLHDMELWKWCFAQNPCQHSGVPFFVIEDNGIIKGGIGYLAVNFRVDNSIYRGFHPVNFFVDTNIREYIHYACFVM